MILSFIMTTWFIRHPYSYSVVHFNNPTQSQNPMLHQTISSAYVLLFTFSSQALFFGYPFYLYLSLYIIIEAYSVPGSGYAVINHKSVGNVTRQQNSINTIIDKATAELLPLSPGVFSLDTPLIQCRIELFVLL